MAIGYDIIIRSSLNGQTLINTFAYGNANVPDVEDQGHMPLLATRAQLIVDQMRANQAASVTYLTYEIRSVYNGLAAYSTGALAGTGTIVADSLPPQAVVSIRLNRVTVAVRHGWNRWSGIPENVSNSGLLAPGYVTAWESSYAQSALLPLDLGSVVLTYGYIYSSYNGQRLPFPQFIECTGVVVSPVIGSQNTRKLGRGI